ncbi:hypothetical protein BGZ65_006072, partial [Modicella reniformis]
WPIGYTENKTAEQGSVAQVNATVTELNGVPQEGVTTSATAAPPGEENAKKEDSTTLPSMETKSENTVPETADQTISTTSTPTHTQPVHTSTAATNASNSNTLTMAETNTPARDEVSEVSVPQAPVTTAEHSTPSKAANESEVHARNSREDLGMEPVVLAPEVQETPNVEGAFTDIKNLSLDSSSTSSMSTTSTESSSTPSLSSVTVEPSSSPRSPLSSTKLSPKPVQGQLPPTIEMEVVALTDPLQPKLHGTTLADVNTKDEASQKPDLGEAKEKEEDEVAKVAKKVGELDLEKRG